MAVYSFSYDDLGNDEYCRSMQLDELHVYGSSRIAVSKPQATLYKECFELTSPTFDSEGFLSGGTFLELPGGEDNTNSSYQYTITRGLKYYEISNHLGNVMSTLRDRKLPQESSGDIASFTPDVSSWQDYLPFGMLMYHRNGDDGEVGRYGFIGAENDNEISGTGNAQDHLFRSYDPRLGRYKSLDPLARDYPWNSSYAYAENRVIDGFDLEGLEYLSNEDARIEVVRGEVKLKVENFNWISRRLWNNANCNPQNWTYNEKNGQMDIGISRSLGNLKYAQSNPIPTPGAANINANDDNPIANDAQHRVQNPTTQQSNYTKENQSYKQRTVSGGSNMRAPAAKGLVALNVLNAGVEYGILGAGMYEEYKVNQHIEVLNKAYRDVLQGISQGLVPEQYLNTNDLSSILNVVLQGESNSDNTELYDIGMNIYNTISNPPQQED